MPKTASSTGAAPEFSLVADWPAPAHVHTLITTRNGGTSYGPWSGSDGSGGLNLGTRCGDAPANVVANRALLRRGLPAEPVWLNQVHRTEIIDAASIDPARIESGRPEPEADGSFANREAVVCAVLVADCMPILFCEREGTTVAVAHAGWRGLVSGIIDRTILAMGIRPERLMTFLGPAIGPTAFEVGYEVHDAFVAADANSKSCFESTGCEKWLCDLEGLARRGLRRAGVGAVYGGGFCTYSEANRFYSFRRDRVTGRMAALIWLDAK